MAKASSRSVSSTWFNPAATRSSILRMRMLIDAVSRINGMAIAKPQAVVISAKLMSLASTSGLTLACVGQFAERPHHAHHRAEQSHHGGTLDHGVDPTEALFQIGQHVALKAIHHQVLDLGVADLPVVDRDQGQLRNGAGVTVAEFGRGGEIAAGQGVLQFRQKLRLGLFASEIAVVPRASRP